MDSNATPLPAVWLPTAYLVPVSYYCKLYASRQAYVDGWEHYVKQTYRNRCIIASPHGRQALTVPIERNDPSHTAVRDIRLSNHGNWRHLHWQALVTAYDASPYFEYYADDLHPVLERPYTYLLDLNEALRDTVCRLLDLQPRVRLTDHYEPTPDALDCRTLISPKNKREDPSFRPVPYYQVFQSRHGFMPDLSIADLLFNMGPEALLVLRDSTAATAL